MAAEPPTMTDPLLRVPEGMKGNREGTDFVKYSGLLWLLHEIAQQLSGDGVARFTVETEPLQIPADSNGMLAIIQATVCILDANGSVIRRARQVGDASPTSVTRMVLPHLLRMADTRAIARCLRTLTNVGVVALEELGDDSGNTGSGASVVPSQPVGPDVYKDASGKDWDRPAMLAKYSVAYDAALARGDNRKRLPDTAPLKAIAQAIADLRPKANAPGSR